jgi:transketolase
MTDNSAVTALCTADGADGQADADLDAAAIACARVLPLDVVQAKGSGHAGTAVSLTPLMYVLFQRHLRHDPADPHWPGRDRFVLSCGHTSLSLYLQLYLSGYGLELDDLRATRTYGSRTPGHPEVGVTPGVETSTGPLGQGVANAVGMAMAALRLRDLLDPGAPARTSVFDHRVFCLASDGDVQEGISHEASALAGHLRLGNLVLLWDDNRISIEGPTALATSEDVLARYRAYGWRVLSIDDAEDLGAIDRVLAEAGAPSDRPTFVRVRTRIGHPMPELGGTSAAHSGAPGDAEVARTKAALGLDPEATFDVPERVLAHARAVAGRGARTHAAWDRKLAQWRAEQPHGAALLDRLEARTLPDGWRDALPRFTAADGPLATRQASHRTLEVLLGRLPELWGGSADLAETNGVPVDGLTGFGPARAGQLVHFGIREHAMAAILNGIALAGPTRPFGATFFVFSDYMRPAIRLAALMRLPVVYVLSHDSVAVGEDGPTHQPVEHLCALRAIPGLTVLRPADGNETVAAWASALEGADGPAALVLSRQALPQLDVARDVVEDGVRRGGYVVTDTRPGDPDVLLLATGSEVHLAVRAAGHLAEDGIAARVVSMPSVERFLAQPAAYRDVVLPPALAARVSVEAGVTDGWYRFVGTHGRTIGVESFGASGNGEQVLAAAGVTVERVVQAARDTLADARAARAGTRRLEDPA